MQHPVFTLIRNLPAASGALTLGLFAALPAQADSFHPETRVTAVTLYPSGAETRREVMLEAPAGQHEVILTGLPADFDGNSLRIMAEGADLASFVLQDSRALPDTAPEAEAIAQARAAVDKAEAALAEFDQRVNLQRAELQARKDMIAIYTGNDGEKSGGFGPEVLEAGKALLPLLVELRQDITRIETDIAAMAPERRPFSRALDQAERALEAAMTGQDGTRALVLSLDVAEGATPENPAHITIDALSRDAGWDPVYDLRLDTESGELRLDRGVVVHQSTGEDWRDVSLRLSTTRPSAQSTPSPISTWLIRAEDESQEMLYDSAPVMAEMAAPMAREESAYAPEMTVQGPIVTYDYGQKVTIRDRADALHLTLGSDQLEPEIFAKGNAASDSTAFLFAEADNSGATILPGQATLYANGVMVGQTGLDLIAAGDRIEQGFGPLDGVVIERRTPRREDGSRGIVRRSDAIEDETEILVTNHTDRAWPLVLVDRIPVAEQKEVEVSWKASPAPDRTDPKSERGVVEWDLNLKPGAETLISTHTRITWPSSHKLRGYP